MDGDLVGLLTVAAKLTELLRARHFEKFLPRSVEFLMGTLHSTLGRTDWFAHLTDEEAEFRERKPPFQALQP